MTALSGHEPQIKISIPAAASRLLGALRRAGFEAYVVGGCVRDSLLGRTPGDWDICTSARPEQVRTVFSAYRQILTGEKHGTVAVIVGGTPYEITTYRVDGQYHDSRHPDAVQFVPQVQPDLARRDFTINAMAYHPEHGLVDLFGGMEDINRKIIRCVGDPVERFTEDALRMLRAVRFSAQLGFTVEENTKAALARMSGNLEHVSAERIQTELVKLLVSDHPDYLRTAWETGLTREFLPEFDACMETAQNTPHHCCSVGEHILKSLTEIENDRLLRITMLLHDIAKPVVKKTDENGRDHFKTHGPAGEKLAGKILRRLKFDNVTIRNTCRLIRYHDLRPTPDAEDVRRAVNLIGEELFPLYLKVQKADLLSQSTYRREEKLARLSGVTEAYQGILERGECTSLKTLAVSGKDLIKAGHPAGPALGALLERLLDCVLKDPTLNTKEKLLETAEKDSIKTE